MHGDQKPRQRKQETATILTLVGNFLFSQSSAYIHTSLIYKRSRTTDIYLFIYFYTFNDYNRLPFVVGSFVVLRLRSQLQ